MQSSLCHRPFTVPPPCFLPPAQRLQRDTAARLTRLRGLAALPPAPEDVSRGHLTLELVLRRDLSPTLFERLQSATHRGTVLLRERVAHQQLLSLVRWEQRQEFNAAAALEGEGSGAQEPVIRSLPPPVVHLISAYEM